MFRTLAEGASVLDVRVSLKGGRPIPASEQDRVGAEWYFNETKPYHEAAHAVVALALGCHVNLLTLDLAEARDVCGNSEAHGATLMSVPDDPDIRAAIAIAGVLQDAEHGCPTARPDGEPSAAFATSARQGSRDFAAFERLAPTMSDRHRVLARVRALLSAFQSYVELVGQALKDKGRLSREEVLALVSAETERRQGEPGAVELVSGIPKEG
jgi:hypothetical protein